MPVYESNSNHLVHIQSQYNPYSTLGTQNGNRAFIQSTNTSYSFITMD